MKMESVRLQHAQGVPNHYIANQIYYPADEDHKKRGSFIILLNQINVPQGSFVASLINTLIREYYRQNHADRLSCFEQTLMRLNEHIKHYLRSIDNDTANLHGSIVLVTGDEIHISHIGTPIAYLAREKDLIPLSDIQADQTAAAKTFSVITSGEVFADDILILVAGVENAAELDHDISFSLKHTPLFESGRAFARIFKQKSERAAEATLVRFNTVTEETSQVYVDRALETTAEKLDHYKRHISHHGTMILSGMQFLGDKLGKTAQERIAKPKITTHTPLQLHENESPEITSTVTTLDEDIAPTHSLQEAEILDSSPSAFDFKVTNYWSNGQELPPVHHASAGPSDTEPDQEPEHKHTPRQHKAKSLFPLSFLSPRALYLLVGALILLGLGIKITNVITKDKASPSQVAQERDSLLLSVETAARDADAAQIRDDIPTAIEKIIEANTLLNKLPQSSQNERSKTLASRISQTLATLTNATTLAADGQTVSLDAHAKKIVATINGTYVFTQDNAIQKVPQGSVSLQASFPKNVQFIDAVPYDNFQKIAVALKNSEGKIELYSLTTVNDEISLLNKSDDKPWPEFKYLASFETNLYFVGDKMYKGTFKDNKYRVTDYATKDDTSKLTSILNNGFAFYGIESSKQLVRIAANTTKTPVKLFGVPEAFLPKVTARLISTRKEGSLYLFDQDQQRILLVSTDGAYKQQYYLPKDATFTDCDATDKTFLCVTTDKQIKTFTFVK